MEWLIAALAASLITGGLALLSRRPPISATAQPPLPALFKPKALLTENELEFLGRLEKAAPELRFHAQVAMGALLNPAVSRYLDGREFFRLRGQFSQKIVDFVAQHRGDGRIIAVIELDDRTHSTEKDAQRDNMLRQAGYKVVRWHSQNKPDIATIRRELLNPLITKPNISILSAALARFKITVCRTSSL